MEQHAKEMTIAKLVFIPPQDTRGKSDCVDVVVGWCASQYKESRAEIAAQLVFSRPWPRDLFRALNKIIGEAF